MTEKKNGQGGFILTLILILLAAAALIYVVAGGELAKYNSKSDIIADSAFADMLSEALGKPQRKISYEDMSSVKAIELVDYSDDYSYAVFCYEGYDDEALPEEERYNYIKSAALGDHDIKSFADFALFTGVEDFRCMYTSIYDFSFLTSFENLETLTLSSNPACDDYSFIGEISTLRNLALDETSLDDIGFVSTLSSLETFSAAQTNIADISPLAGLTKLQKVYLANNRIQDVTPLANLTELTLIDLTGNAISDVSSLTNYNPETFTRIILDLNPWIEDYTPLTSYLGEDKVQRTPNN